MTLSNEDEKIIQEEVHNYEGAFTKIRAALAQKARELEHDEALARSLTAQMVAQTRDEEKQALSSDEKVAHGLAKLRLGESQSLTHLAREPYFARVVYNENGRSTEFKLGTHSFPELRIIDWRKGPISKLYYNYEEGDEYDDEIAGQERHGQITLKRGFRGLHGELSQIEHRDWSLIKARGVWQKNKKFANEPFSIDDKTKIKELLAKQGQLDWEGLISGTGYLSQILALLTPEQFEWISKDTEHPVVIQGSAGTGKTSVALHRLAWLLFSGNSKIKSENTLVVVFHKPLVEYVKNVLPALGIDNVKITTYLDWAKDLLQTTLGQKLHFAQTATPDAVQVYKSSEQILSDLLAFAATSALQNADDLLFEFYKHFSEPPLAKRGQGEFLQEQNPLGNSPNPLFARGGFQKDFSFLNWQAEHRVVDIYDLALLLFLLDQKETPVKSQKYPTRLDHLVIDEAQDFNWPEILALTSFLHEKHQVTIAGDLGQKILDHRHFGSWPELLAKLGFIGSDALNLTVAFRSTYQIYELAEYVRDPNANLATLKLTPKFGPDPTATKAHSFESAAELVKDWIQDQLNLNQNLQGAILCVDDNEAKLLFHFLTKHGTVGIRYSDANHFKFAPGIVITAIKNVKGLEFHTVCLFNPSEKHYSPFSLTDRNKLYVGISRALYRFDAIGYDDFTPMLPESLEKIDLTAIPLDDEDGARHSDFAADADSPDPEATETDHDTDPDYQS